MRSGRRLMVLEGFAAGAWKNKIHLRPYGSINLSFRIIAPALPFIRRIRRYWLAPVPELLLRALSNYGLRGGCDARWLQVPTE